MDDAKALAEQAIAEKLNLNIVIDSFSEAIRHGTGLSEEIPC